MTQAFARATDGTGDRIAQALGAQAGGGYPYRDMTERTALRILDAAGGLADRVHAIEQAGGISAGDITDEAVAEMVRDEWEV